MALQKLVNKRILLSTFETDLFLVRSAGQNSLSTIAFQNGRRNGFNSLLLRTSFVFQFWSEKSDVRTGFSKVDKGQLQLSHLKTLSFRFGSEQCDLREGRTCVFLRPVNQDV